MILHALVVVSLLAVQAARPAQPTPPPVPAGTSTIYGRITRGDDTPLGNVTVEIRMMGKPGGRSDTVTDPDGHYAFESIAAGRYMVSPKLEHHVVVSSVSFGLTTIPGATVVVDDLPVTTKPGARQRTDFTMQRGATIAGRIGNESGAPFPDVFVGATQIGSTFQLNSNNTKTNARGEFELTVPPGDFLIRAIAPPAVNGTDYIGYVGTFYPGVASQKEAAAIRVSPGDVARGVDFSLSIAGGHTVRGRVTASSGEPAVASLTLTTSPGNSVRTGHTKPDGTFMFGHLQPGRYTLAARSSGTQDSEGAWTVVTISEGVHELVFQLEPTGSIRGRILTGNGEVAELEGARVGAALTDGTTDVDPLLPAQAEVAADGSFAIDGVFGPRTFRVYGLPAGWSVQSVMIGGTEVKGPHVTIQPAVAIDNVTIVITRNND